MGSEEPLQVQSKEHYQDFGRLEYIARLISAAERHPGQARKRCPRSPLEERA